MKFLLIGLGAALISFWSVFIVLGNEAFITRIAPFLGETAPPIEQDSVTIPEPMNGNPLDTIPSEAIAFYQTPDSSRGGELANKAGRRTALSGNTEILMGDTLYTGPGDTVTVEDQDNEVTITLSENSSLGFINTIPGTMVFGFSGEVEVIAGSQPVSLRTPSTLVEISGSAVLRIEEDNTRLVVEVLDGIATIAFTDNEGETQIQTVESGEIGTKEGDTLTVEDRSNPSATS